RGKDSPATLSLTNNLAIDRGGGDATIRQRRGGRNRRPPRSPGRSWNGGLAGVRRGRVPREGGPGLETGPARQGGRGHELQSDREGSRPHSHPLDDPPRHAGGTGG